jgi:transketolase
MANRRTLANAIRVLSMDAVQKANSGHPGAPMGMADIAEVLWNDYMVHNPANPSWFNRDRFVLSNGHGSMLIYSLLHLSGYDLSMEDIKSFRQMDAKTPGHPEYGYTPGVETTTGPLGQGLANAVGMALTEKVLAAQFNKKDVNLVDHHTYVFLGDGCLMEGISHEVSSLAGTLGLGKLVAFYDDNQISIDGDVSGWFTDKTAKRFEAYGWQVISKVDGHDFGAIKAAIEVAQADEERPTLICCKTKIGAGAPNKEGTAACHGAPLGDEEIAATRVNLDWPHAPFEVPEDVYAGWNATAKGSESETNWSNKLEKYKASYPQEATEFDRRISGELPANFDQLIQRFIEESQAEGTKVASRKASQMAIEKFAAELPEMLGGSADLTGSNLTNWSGSKTVTAHDASGNYIYYGVREFGMAAIMNGMALHSGVIPYGGTFLIFMEYARNAIRMAALMKQRSIYVFTHDSIGLGEDGPTHQPVEQITSLRSTPNMHTWRPCDTVETMAAWGSALSRLDGPTALALSRQGLSCQPRSTAALAQIKKGGYTLSDSEGAPEVIVIATGSEVGLAVDAKALLANASAAKVRIVSMPCVELFAAQDTDYQDSVIPDGCRKRLAIEAGHSMSWYKLVGLDGTVIGLDRFGESAPGPELMEHFGFSTDNVVNAIEQMLS